MMRFIVLVTIITSLFVLGCSEYTEIKDIIDDKIVVVEPEEKEPTSLEKAQQAMQKVNDIRDAVYQQAEEDGDFSVLFAAAEEIFQDELGFEKEYWQQLVFIWEEIQIEKFQAGELDEEVANRYLNFYNTHQKQFLDKTLAKSYFDFIGAYDEIIIDYLRISYDNPDSSQNEIIELFKDSIKEGNVKILYPEGF